MVEVFQLFVVDGLVAKSSGLSIGILGTHIAEEEVGQNLSTKEVDLHQESC